MSDKETPKFRENAIRYVDAQLATMQKYGSAPVLSPGEYYSLVDEAEQAGRRIWEASRER